MKKKRTFLVAICLCVIAGIPVARAQGDFFTQLKTLTWVCYAPTNFDPLKGVYPTPEQIREDLEVLYKHGFRGLVTYSAYSTLGQIPALARAVGFKGMIMGVWSMESEEEISAAIGAQQFVDGYCVGNEGLNTRYSIHVLKEVITKIKSATGKPATTSEGLDAYFYNPHLVEASDWLFPILHPIFARIKVPHKAGQWLEKRLQCLEKQLARKGFRKFIVMKEVGFPTGGERGCSRGAQYKFLRYMDRSNLTFVYFEAFDQPWKQHHPVEPHWGLFTAERKPKTYIQKKRWKK